MLHVKRKVTVSTVIIHMGEVSPYDYSEINTEAAYSSNMLVTVCGKQRCHDTEIILWNQN
jgi:hypothetical protein